MRCVNKAVVVGIFVNFLQLERLSELIDIVECSFKGANPAWRGDLRLREIDVMVTF